jgi:hypothetical protein
MLAAMATITISLDDQQLDMLRAQAREVNSTPEDIAAQFVTDGLDVPHPSPKIRAIIARQLRDYEKAFDRLAE